jgi:hypothetical protein
MYTSEAFNQTANESHYCHFSNLNPSNEVPTRVANELQ